MSKFWLLAVVGAAAALAAAVTAEAKKPSLRGSRWVCVQEMFVADAGTEMQTYTLTFTSAKKCVFTSRWVLPAHPGMYMNPDGTVDTIPESFSESERKGTWRYKRDAVTVTFEDGSTETFLYLSGNLIGSDPYGLGGGHRVFVKQ